jgi:peptide-methionine (S)-S-oxide reductase
MNTLWTVISRNPALILWLGLTLSFSITSAGNKPGVQTDRKTMSNKKTEEATFGTGCFWCSEAIFSRLKGVMSVTPGYSGGKTKNPSYDEVCTGETGHAEVVRIVYDPSVITFEELLEVFWKTHDPTTPNRQGADVGTQYRSVIFYHNEKQKELAEHYKQKLNEEKIWKNPVVTEISPLTSFYPAEDYHKNYYENNPAKGYCNFVITPKVEKFEKIFREKIK